MSYNSQCDELSKNMWGMFLRGMKHKTLNKTPIIALAYKESMGHILVIYTTMKLTRMS